MHEFNFFSLYSKKIVLNKRVPKHAKADHASLNSSEDYGSGFNYVQSTELNIK